MKQHLFIKNFIYIFLLISSIFIRANFIFAIEVNKEIITDSNAHSILVETQFLDSTKNLYLRSHYKLPEMKLIFKEKVRVVDDNQYTLIRYNFEKENLISIDEFNEFSRITKREVVDEQENVIEEIIYFYTKPNDYNPHAFIRKNSLTGDIIARYDNTDLSFNLNRVFSRYSIEDIEEKIALSKNLNRTLVAIIDSGVDHNHPNLAYKFMINNVDPIDDIDNDFDGLTDNFIGWSIPLKKGLPVEKINPSSETIPLSHGTHVADIMLKDVDQAMLLPFTGDYGESYFLDIASATFQKLKPSFANLSFLFPHYSLQEVPKETYFSLRNLIKNNPDTLFFTAAGNDFGKELKNGRSGLYPACFDFENIITVGAIDTNEIIESSLPDYKLAPYSNFGIEHVDILAPGSEIEAASLGGGTIKHTGTSMATPFALNVALKIKIQFPGLTGQEIKNILMYSAYITNVDNPFKVRSGGIIFPRRAMEVARRYYSTSFVNDILTIRSISKEVRLDPVFTLANELFSTDYFQKLENIWSRF